MPTCKICLRTFKKIRFNSSRICICGRCTNFLNECREVAQESYKAIGDLLKTGMLNRAHSDIAPNVPLWRQERAKRTLENLDQEYRDALPNWTNRLLKNPENHTKIFKIARAHRRKLLHYDRPHGWGYPKDWLDVASNIRELDGYKCVTCGAKNVELHVHHIIYTSNFGTHQKYNLVTLCRPCHEEEHETVFDFGENLISPDMPPTT